MSIALTDFQESKPCFHETVDEQTDGTLRCRDCGSGDVMEETVTIVE